MAAFDGAASVVWLAAPEHAAAGLDLGSSSCGYLTNVLFWRDGEAACSNMAQLANTVLAAEMKPCDVVIIHNSHDKLQSEQEAMEQYNYLSELQRLVGQKGAHLVLLGDSVGLNEREPQMCLAGLAASCQRQWDDLTNEFVWERQIYDALAAASNSTFHMPIAELFCSLNGECGVHIPGTATSAYGDHEHLSNAGATYLWPFIASFFIQNGLL